MRTIQAIDVFPVLLPVTRTFQFASGTAGKSGEMAPYVFVKMTDSEGEVGWGEGRPMPSWAYETVESVTTTIRSYLAPALLSLPIFDRYEVHKRMQSVIGTGPSIGQPIAKSALDMALHDLCARACNLSLRCFLGGSMTRRSVALSYTITAHETVTASEEVLQAKELGFRHFNFKAAVTLENDIAVAQAIRAAAGQDAFVWADANQGLPLHTAVRIAQALADAGVDVLEQPFAADQFHLMQQLRARTSFPLAIDEASVSPADFFRYAAHGLVDYLVIKLARSGGIWPTLQQIATAQSAGLPLLVSGLTESHLSRVAACQVAAAFGYAGPAALNGNQFIDDTALYPAKQHYEYDGTVHLPDGPGIGVAPSQEQLESLMIKELRP